MLDSLTNFFDWLYSFLGNIGNFLISIIDGLLNIIKSLPVVMNMISSSIGYLPSTLAAFATLTITISIVYLLVGRDTGG